MYAYIYLQCKIQYISEEANLRCFTEELFWKFLQMSQDNTCDDLHLRLS